MIRGVATLVAAAVVVVAVTVGWSHWHGGGDSTAPNDECTATVSGHQVALDPEQARWAGLIVAISVARGMPARAASIALATAYQESHLYNLHSGDRDSVGLFQQRPSQGWGSRSQLLDPVYATNAFYDALARLNGYQTMPITDAAQAVQRSGFPQAYAAHESAARALAAALSGNSGHAFSCRLADRPTHGSASRAVHDVGTVFTSTPVSSSGSRLVVGAATPVRGWAVAQYLVSQAHRLHLAWVSYAGRTWTAGARSDDGWRADASTSGTDRVEAAVGG